jgi:hypothetical protein
MPSAFQAGAALRPPRSTHSCGPSAEPMPPPHLSPQALLAASPGRANWATGRASAAFHAPVIGRAEMTPSSSHGRATSPHPGNSATVLPGRHPHILSSSRSSLATTAVATVWLTSP